jgi:methylase of polypeptide subunit release factors
MADVTESGTEAGELGAAGVAPIHGLLRLDPAILDRLRVRLAEVGFTQEVVFAAEKVAPGQLDVVRLPLVQWWLAQEPAAGAEARTLARLFVYAAAVPAAEVRAALGELVAPLTETGLLAPAAGDALRAAFRLVPLEGLWILSDAPEGGGDAVMGPGITTQGLARLLPRSPGSTLDLGCGAGTLALLAAARGSRRAVGVDLNPRAIELARLNARLNGLSADFRCGDLVAPVEGERFDLVYAQPPYVVLPAGVEATTYLHGGRAGDELALRFSAAAARVLAPRGRAFVLFDSAKGGRAPLPDRLGAALGDTPVDLVLFAAPGPSADQQAVAYASLEERDLGPRYRSAVSRYRQHLEEVGAREFMRALVFLEEAAGRDRLVLQLPVSSLGLDAERLEAYLGCLAVARAAPQQLLAATVRVAPGARFVEERPPSAPAGEPKRSVRFPKGDLGSDQELSEAGLALFAALQDAPDVAAAVDAFAAACGEPAAAVRDQVIGFVREGLVRGLLVRV